MLMKLSVGYMQAIREYGEFDTIRWMLLILSL